MELAGKEGRRVIYRHQKCKKMSIPERHRIGQKYLFHNKIRMNHEEGQLTSIEHHFLDENSPSIDAENVRFFRICRRIESVICAVCQCLTMRYGGKLMEIPDIGGIEERIALILPLRGLKW